MQWENKAAKIAKLAKSTGAGQTITTLLVRLLWLKQQGILTHAQAQAVIEPFRKSIKAKR